jgi:hypothetical protein
MTFQTIKLDCSSPLINYQPLSGWQKGGADGDPFTSRRVVLQGVRCTFPDTVPDRYDNGTFMFATQANTSFSFNFTGTSIEIVGAVRSNHGPFAYVSILALTLSRLTRFQRATRRPTSPDHQFE